MKSDTTNKPFPKTDSEWEALIANAPGKDVPATAHNSGDLQEKSVVVRAGGFDAVRSELQVVRRRRGERGPQKAPTKERITIRLSPDVVQQFRASGAGWQTRIDQALKEWLKEHPVT